MLRLVLAAALTLAVMVSTADAFDPVTSPAHPRGGAHAAIKLLVLPDFPPFMYQDNGRLQGLYLDIVGAVFDAMGQPYSLELVPIKRALRMAKNGQGLVVGILKTPARTRDLTFSAPFYRERLVIFSQAESGGQLDALAQLHGLRVGTTFGWSYGPAFDAARAAHLFNAEDHDLVTGFRMLSLGRLDALVHTDLAGRYLIAKQHLAHTIRVSTQPFHYGDVYIAGRSPALAEVIAAFNHTLAQPALQAHIEQLIAPYRALGQR